MAESTRLSTQAATYGATVPVIWQSEMCTHNASGKDEAANPLWFAVRGSVYDVQSFVDTHPGGVRIVADVSGMDATKAFQLVAHDVNNEVMGRMASHHIGTLREVSSAAVERTRLHAVRAAAERPWRVPELCDLARKTVYSFVELQNSFVNDLNSIREMASSTARSKVDWHRGKSMQDVRPLVSFCQRVLQLFEPGGFVAQAVQTAAHMRTLACEPIAASKGDAAGTGADDPKWSRDLKDIEEYVTIMRTLIYVCGQNSSVAQQMALRASIDLGGVHANLLTIANAGVATIGAIKTELLSALRGLEGLLRDAEGRMTDPYPLCESNGGDGNLDDARVAERLRACAGLPAVLDRLVGRGFCGAVITQLDPVLLEAVAAPPAPGGTPRLRASTLTQLRALHLENAGAVPAPDGDEMLQEELSKIEGWLMMGEVRTLIAAKRIIRMWRLRSKGREPAAGDARNGGEVTGPTEDVQQGRDDDSPPNGGSKKRLGVTALKIVAASASPRNAYHKIKNSLWRAEY